jgi:DNA-nicking Smr family endonuclease
LLITGKGIHSNTDNDIYASKDLSKLRFSVPEYIKSDDDIAKHLLSVTKADKKDGGEGAIIIKLK